MTVLLQQKLGCRLTYHTMSSTCMPMNQPCPFDNVFPIGMPVSWWQVNSPSALPGACLGVAFLGLLRHLLPALRVEVFLANTLPAASTALRSVSGDGQSLLSDEGGLRGKARVFAPLTARLRPYLAASALRRSPLLLRLADALIFGAGAALGFFNMLVVCVVESSRERRPV